MDQASRYSIDGNRIFPARFIVRFGLIGLFVAFCLIMPHKALASVNSAYSETNVATPNGTFFVRYIRINLDNPNLRVYSLNVTSGECDQCGTKSLGGYITEVNGFAGINGSYFCPADYPGCAGGEGSSFWLWYNSLTKLFANESHNPFNTSGSVLAIGTNNRATMYPIAKDWPGQARYEQQRNTTLQALFSNGPGLIYKGENITETFSMDNKQRTVHSLRSGVGIKGRNMYLVVASRATVIDLGQVMEAMNMDYAVNLDGGGSTALWYDGAYRVGPGRNIPNALVFGEADKLPPEVAPGPSFFAYDKNMRGGFDVASGNVQGSARSEVITGTGSGFGPQVQIYNRFGDIVDQFFAFSTLHRSGVRVSTCDVDGDAYDEIVTAEGPGQRPRVRIFKSDGTRTASFLTINGRSTKGLNIACGDVDGDGQSEIIAAASRNGGPRVWVYDRTGKLERVFSAYLSQHHGGVNLATADMNDDGKDEIITAPETGIGQVRTFSVRSGQVRQVAPSFYPFGKQYNNGIDVSIGDLDGNGRPEIIVSRGPNSDPIVKVYSTTGQAHDLMHVFSHTFQGGIRVASGDVDEDGKDEVLVTPWSDGGPQVRILSR